MPTADNSYAERMRRRRAVATAAFRAANPTARELSPNQNNDRATLIVRQFGQTDYRKESPTGKIDSEPGCC
jgi:hypothetical protein